MGGYQHQHRLIMFFNLIKIAVAAGSTGDQQHIVLPNGGVQTMPSSSDEETIMEFLRQRDDAPTTAVDAFRVEQAMALEAAERTSPRGEGEESSTSSGGGASSTGTASGPAGRGSSWRAPTAQELGAAADTLTVASKGVRAGFAIADKSTKFGFGCARWGLSWVPGLGPETINPVGKGLHGILNMAQGITEMSQGLSEGITQVCIKGAGVGLDVAGAERGTLAVAALKRVGGSCYRTDPGG